MPAPIHYKHPRKGFEAVCLCTPWDHSYKLVTADPEVVTCKTCLRAVGRHSMTFAECLDITLELANGNVLDYQEAEANELQESRANQVEAVERVHDLLALLKGD